MLEVWFGVALGLLLASNVALWLKLDNCYKTLTSLITKKSADLEKSVDMNEIREEIGATIDEFLGGLHVPTGIDHVWGMVANIGGAWAQQRFGQAKQFIENVVDSDQTED